MKIAIIGYSRSGKSIWLEKTFQLLLHSKLHIDRLQFQPGWQIAIAIELEMKTRFLNASWVDGSYMGCSYEGKNGRSDYLFKLLSMELFNQEPF